MRRRLMLLAFILLPLAALPASAATGRIIKVLPQFLDLDGRHTVSPSLYDRDAYQAYLRMHTNHISALRFMVEWKSRGASSEGLKVRIELLGVAEGKVPRKTTLEKEVKPGWLNQWTALVLGGEDYKRFGEVTSWRASLWLGDQMLGEQKSFLW